MALLLVDGFAGTGKSTLAQRLWLHLRRRGQTARWWHEHEAGHPIVEYGEVDELLRQPVEAFEARVVSGWTALAAVAAGPAVHIVEGSFVQIPVGVMLAMGAPPARIRALLRRIDTIVAAPGTSLVYLHQPDLRRAFDHLGRLRSPVWLESMTAALSRSPYGRRHRVCDLNGLVTYYERQRAIVESVLPRLTLRQQAVDVSAGRWAREERAICAFVGVRRTPARRQPLAELLRHVGHYRSASGAIGVVTTDARRLYLQMPASRAVPMIEVEEGHYCLESLPVDVRFVYTRRGAVRRLVYESRMVNEVLSETSWMRS